MRWKFVLAVALALPLCASAARAQTAWWGHSNDTGGIIPWSPEIAHTYRELAAEKCARWNKVAVITSVHRQYGDYIGFACLWPRNYDPEKAGRWWFW